MSYACAVKYLYDLQKHSIKLGLERTGKLLSVLDNPHLKFSAVHVAGTNGKGSVAAMISSMLVSGGFKVGLFTSPHLVSFTERIRINNIQIPESEVVRLIEEIKESMGDIIAGAGEPTFFEFVTAMAFLYFSENNVDWAVVEVGMGGRLDATNLIVPKVSVITGISHDHKEFLGNSLSEIASEKAGIIKNGIPVVCSVQESEVEMLLREKASSVSAPFFIFGKDFSGTLKSTDTSGTTLDYNDREHALADLYVPLAGEHQVINACVAVKAFLCVQRYDTAIREGLASVMWQGRLEFVGGEPPIILDGAHNPHAAAALAEFMKKKLAGYRIILIAGIMSDKDIEGILSPLLPLVSDIIFTAPDYGRSAPPGLLVEQAALLGFQSTVAPSVGDAVARAKDMAFSRVDDLAAPPLILITGSFFTIGEAKELMGEKAVLGGLREKYLKKDEKSESGKVQR